MEKKLQQEIINSSNKIPDSEKESMKNAVKKLIEVLDVINQFPEPEKEHLKKSLIVIVKKEIKKIKTKSSKHL